jgi:RNA polymerase sigma-70 factor (ECF subfamily)
MLEDATPMDLLRRLRGGEEQAAAELFRRYEAVIRRRVRVWMRLQDQRLRRAFDSADVCQSVLASFFLRAAAGQYDLNEPEQMVALLFRMARNKLLHQVNREQAERRDIRRDVAKPNTAAAADPSPSPSSQLAGRELLDEARRRLSAEERRLAELRAAGREWADIAAELGGTAEGRRKQLARALDQVVRQLGIDDGTPEG